VHSGATRAFKLRWGEECASSTIGFVGPVNSETSRVRSKRIEWALLLVSELTAHKRGSGARRLMPPTSWSSARYINLVCGPLILKLAGRANKLSNGLVTTFQNSRPTNETPARRSRYQSADPQGKSTSFVCLVCGPLILKLAGRTKKLSNDSSASRRINGPQTRLLPAECRSSR
jgi:hypothetical protein